MKPSKQALAGWVAFAVGLFVTWRGASSRAWRQAGLDRDASMGSADCDQCELTVLLDQIGLVLACFAVYLLLAGTAWFVWRRRDRPRAPSMTEAPR